jgi:hypothetical protein
MAEQPHESYNSYGAKFDAFKEQHQKRLEYIKKLKKYDNDDYDDYDDHDEATMLKKLRLELENELEKKYELENHSHELENLKKKNQSLQDALRVTKDLLASKLIDLRVRKTFFPFILKFKQKIMFFFYLRIRIVTLKR